LEASVIARISPRTCSISRPYAGSLRGLICAARPSIVQSRVCLAEDGPRLTADEEGLAMTRDEDMGGVGCPRSFDARGGG
jgi:hypothetical protein